MPSRSKHLCLERYSMTLSTRIFFIAKKNDVKLKLFKIKAPTGHFLLQIPERRAPGSSLNSRSGFTLTIFTSCACEWPRRVTKKNTRKYSSKCTIYFIEMITSAIENKRNREIHVSMVKRILFFSWFCSGKYKKQFFVREVDGYSLIIQSILFFNHLLTLENLQ